MSSSNPVSILIEESLALERSGDIAAGLQKASQALVLARTMDDSTAQAEALVGVARFRFRLGQYETAQRLSQEALSLTNPYNPTNAAVHANALLSAGMCAAETNALSVAEKFYRAAADVGREMGDHLIRLRALHDLSAGVYLPRGQFELALAADQEAYQVARLHNLWDWLFFPLISIAITCQVTGQLRLCHATLDELVQVSQPGSPGMAYYFYLSGCLAQDEGDAERVPGFYGKALSIAESTGDPGLNVEIRLGLSRYHRLAGDGPKARTWADDAYHFAIRVGYLHKQGRSLAERGRAAWLCGDLSSAAADLRAAIEILTPLEINFDAVYSRFLLAALLHQQKSPEAAALWREAAREILASGYAFLLDQERLLAFPLIAAYLKSLDPDLAHACATLVEQLQRVPPLPLRVNTLGGLEVWQGARPLEKRTLRQRRVGELLSLLLLSPSNTLALDQVAEALCPEKEPASAQGFVHHATSGLRHLLEPELPDRQFASRYLEVDEGQIVLRLPSGSYVDYQAFQDHISHREWEKALAIYRGEFLPEFRYADWAVRLRESLSLSFQEALLALAEKDLADKAWETALSFSRRALTIDPWNERAALAGMRALSALNDTPGALRLYRQIEKTLKNELGIAPAGEMQAFYQRLITNSKK